MTPGARLLSVVEIINDIFLQSADEHFSSDKIIKNWIRNNRYAGSKDRKDITNNVFGIIKRYFSIDYIQKNNITLGEHSLELTIIYHIFYGGGKTNLISRFNDGPYAITMTDAINNYIEKISVFNFDKIEFVKCSLPDWLYREFYDSFHNDTYKICESFFKESNFDIRVKKGLSRDKIIQKLKNYNISSEKTPLSPLGIRINKRIPINNLIEYKKGLIEIQDEGSQLVSLLCGAKENETIIDLCAGAGGKSLLLADSLNNVKIIATDINLIRLDKVPSFLISYEPGLLTAPTIETTFPTGLTKIKSPDLSLVLKLDLPKIKVSYKSILSIFLLFLIRSIDLNDPLSDGPPETLKA